MVFADDYCIDHLCRKKKMKKALLIGIATALLSLAGQANANFIVADYIGANSLAKINAAVSTNATPSYTGFSNVVDFYANGGSGGAFSNNYAFPGGLLTNFGADFKTTLNITTPGSYSFRTNADDGVQLIIDGTSIITDSTTHAPQDRFGTINLTSGFHNLDLRYFQVGGGASVELSAKLANSNVGYQLVGSTNGLQTTNVPEPASLALFALGLLGCAAARRKSEK